MCHHLQKVVGEAAHERYCLESDRSMVEGGIAWPLATTISGTGIRRPSSPGVTPGLVARLLATRLLLATAPRHVRGAARGQVRQDAWPTREGRLPQQTHAG